MPIIIHKLNTNCQRPKLIDSCQYATLLLQGYTAAKADPPVLAPPQKCTSMFPGQKYDWFIPSLHISVD